MEEPRPSVHTHTHTTHAHTRKHTTIHTTTLSHTHTHTREVISADLGFTPSTSSIHPCIVHRRSGAEPHVDGEGVAERRSGIKLLPPLTELQLSRNSIADLVRPLGPQCVRVRVRVRVLYECAFGALVDTPPHTKHTQEENHDRVATMAVPASCCHYDWLLH